MKYYQNWVQADTYYSYAPETLGVDPLPDIEIHNKI